MSSISVHKCTVETSTLFKTSSCPVLKLSILEVELGHCRDAWILKIIFFLKASLPRPSSPLSQMSRRLLLKVLNGHRWDHKAKCLHMQHLPYVPSFLLSLQGLLIFFNPFASRLLHQSFVPQQQFVLKPFVPHQISVDHCEN